ncbi:MAG: hypothetical protein KKH98_05410 [Spirochaetes bacterium]|nr:hypothetical protein [Spirochaetota bacterium]
MKKCLSFIAILTFSLIISSSILQADFKNSLRSENSFDLVQDDWDFLIRPMYYDGLKGKMVIVNLDSAWSSNALYMGAALDFFGLNETIAVQYYQEDRNNYSNRKYETHEKSSGTIYTQYTLTIESLEDENYFTPNTDFFDLHLGSSMKIKDMNIGIGIRVKVKDRDADLNIVDNGTITYTNNVPKSYTLQEVINYHIKNTDKEYSFLAGFIKGKLRMQGEFSLLKRKGDGSTYVWTKTNRYASGNILRREKYIGEGDFTRIEGVRTSATLSDDFDLLADNGPIALSGFRYGIEGEITFSKVFTPGASFYMSFYDIDSDEELYTGYSAETEHYDVSGNMKKDKLSIGEVKYIFNSFYIMDTAVYNKSFFNLSEDILLAMALECRLNKTKKDFTLEGSNIRYETEDTNDDGSIDISTIKVTRGLINEYLQETTEIRISFPIYCEISVTENLSLRVGSKLTLINVKTNSTATRFNGPPYEDFTDNYFPENNYTGRLKDHTEETTTRDDSATVLNKEIQFGIGWDINESFSFDTLTSLTLLSGAIDIFSWHIAGTARF